MPRQSSSKPGPNGPESLAALLDRVRARVSEAGATIDRHSSRSASDLEASSMRRVFRQMGKSYRRHRRQTGAQVNAEVREAAIAFKEEPTMDTLTRVAVRLEQNGVLAW